MNGSRFGVEFSNEMDTAVRLAVVVFGEKKNIAITSSPYPRVELMMSPTSKPNARNVILGNIPNELIIITNTVTITIKVPSDPTTPQDGVSISKMPVRSSSASLCCYYSLGLGFKKQKNCTHLCFLVLRKFLVQSGPFISRTLNMVFGQDWWRCSNADRNHQLQS